jgi:hypothetical protein
MRIFIILCWLAVLTSCDEEASLIQNCEPTIPRCDTALNFLPVTDTCFDIPPSPPFGYINIAEEINFEFPVFNPLNSEEFFYSIEKLNGLNLIRSHWKINICTNEKAIV